ncbi:MAG TPA: phosphate ABC transporter permease PstA [Jatrophihabitantaceae bacterium]|jgi:phosphate transport system permease protein
MTTVTTAPGRITARAQRVHGMRRVKNSLATVLITGSFGVALIPLIWLLWTVIGRGWHVIVTSEWWTGDQRGITFRDPGGGALHAIIGTAEEVAICAMISIPLGLLVAIYLVEYGGGRFARITTFMVDILTGIPSIVAALFVYAIFFIEFGAQFAGVYAALALVLLMVPVIVRTTEEMLKLVPDELREASYALGVPKWKTILRIVLPTALSGITTGIVLGIARVAGETAPLLVLVQYSPNTNSNVFSGFQGSLPLMIKSEVKNLGSNYSFTGQKIHNYAPDRMWGAALTLIIIVMGLNLIARLLGRFSKTK